MNENFDTKTFRIIGLGSDYPVLFLQPTATLTDPLWSALNNRGYGDNPGEYLFMWILSSKVNQDVFQDDLGGHGHNIESHEYRAIFSHVSRNWVNLIDGMVLEMYIDDKNECIAVKTTQYMIWSKL